MKNCSYNIVETTDRTLHLINSRKSLQAAQASLYASYSYYKRINPKVTKWNKHLQTFETVDPMTGLFTQYNITTN